MSDAEIKEFSKTRTGSPITKMELDTLNVALASNGGQVFIDDVLQPDSVINDGRRAHIGLDGNKLIKDLNIVFPSYVHHFLDHFLEPYDEFNKVNPAQWTLWKAGDDPRITWGIVASCLKGSFEIVAGYGATCIRQLDYYPLEGQISTYKCRFIPKTQYINPYLNFHTELLDFRYNLAYPSGERWIRHQNRKNGHWTMLVDEWEFSVDDIIEVECFHIDDTTTCIIKQNGTEIVNREIVTGGWGYDDVVGYGVINGWKISYPLNISEVWLDYYSEDIVWL